MTRALLINPGDEHATLIEVDGNDLEAMQKLVGGYLEGLPLPELNAQALINEEGKLLDLPINEQATRLAQASRALLPGDTISGPMVIVSVPAHVLSILRVAGFEVREEER